MIKTWLTILALAAIAGVFTACGAFGERVNPVKAATDTGQPDLIAYALEGSYTIVQAHALAVAQDPATPAAVKNSIIAIAERANPILDELRPLALEATTLKEQIESIRESGGDPAEQQARLAALLTDINRKLTVVAPMISDLIAAVSGDAGDDE